MRIKNGVRFATGELAMGVAASLVDSVYEEFGCDCVVTGGSEGRRPNSLHHRGWALDFRLNNIDTSAADAISEAVRSRLGDGFDVVPHGDGASYHLHVEYDPKD